MKNQGKKDYVLERKKKIRLDDQFCLSREKKGISERIPKSNKQKNLEKGNPKTEGGMWS